MKNEMECSPIIKEAEDKYHSADFNCNNCTETDCFYWHIYNDEFAEKLFTALK